MFGLIVKKGNSFWQIFFTLMEIISINCMKSTSKGCRIAICMTYLLSYEGQWIMAHVKRTQGGRIKEWKMYKFNKWGDFFANAKLGLKL